VLLTTMTAAAALTIRVDRFLDFLAAKHDMAQALRDVLAAGDGLRQQTRESLTDAPACCCGPATTSGRSGRTSTPQTS
jgi:CRP-like cAMP-binding protein